MIREDKNGLKFLILTDGSESLIIESNKMDQCIDYVLNEKIKKITINSYQGYSLPDIDFVTRLSHVIEGIHIPDDKFNISCINSLIKLKELGFADNGKDIIRLMNFPLLERLSCEYSIRLVGLETCKKLKILSLTNYKTLSTDLNELHIMSPLSLNELFLYKTNIMSLDGVEKFKNLKILSLYNAVKLGSIKAIAKGNLQEFAVEKCKIISDYEYLGEVTSLQKIRISDSGVIKSLSFLKSLKQLQFISFVGTNVIDGNLDYCKGIPYVGFDNKRHYNHKMGYFSNNS